MSPRKALFGGWMALHTLPKRCRGRPLVGASTFFFFKYYLIYANYNNASMEPQNLQQNQYQINKIPLLERVIFCF